mgnify:FL=1
MAGMAGMAWYGPVRSGKVWRGMAGMKANRLLLLPSVLLFALTLWAVVAVLRLSLYDSNVVSERFVGLANYGELVRDPAFAQNLGNSLAYALLLIPGQALAPLALGLLIYDVPRSLRNLTVFGLYLPSFTAGIVISTVWRWIWHPTGGLANWLLGLVGLGPVMWMAYRVTAIPAISMMISASTMGFCALIYAAAILAVGQDVIDAARIDGAGGWRIRVGIILPMISSTVRLLTLLALVAAFQMWESIYMMAPVTGAYNLMYDMFQTAFRFSRHGLGAAKAVVLMAICAVLAAGKRRLER